MYYLEEYFVLELLADAALEEVCTNLKQQVLEYINLLREQKIAGLCNAVP